MAAQRELPSAHPCHTDSSRAFLHLDRLMNKMNRLSFVACLAISPLGNATTILIDLGTPPSFRGAAVTNPDPNGNHWNSVWSGAFYADLLDISGNPTSVDFGFSSAAGTDYFNGPSGATQDPAASVYDAVALGPLGVDEAVYDYYVNSSFQIQQLDPSKSYDITFYGSHKFNNDNTTRYGVYTDGSFAVEEAGVELLVGVNADHNQDRLATLNGVSPQADGIIYVSFAGAAGGNGYLNAFSIAEVIPEPTALALVLATAVSAALRR